MDAGIQDICLFVCLFEINGFQHVLNESWQIYMYFSWGAFYFTQSYLLNHLFVRSHIHTIGLFGIE